MWSPHAPMYYMDSQKDFPPFATIHNLCGLYQRQHICCRERAQTASSGQEQSYLKTKSVLEMQKIPILDFIRISQLKRWPSILARIPCSSDSPYFELA